MPVWTVSTFSPQRCTACEVHSSVESTATLSMRGLCQYSYFDTTYQVQYSTVQYTAVQYTSYQVQYDPANIVTYVGKEQTIISFDFEAEVG